MDFFSQHLNLFRFFCLLISHVGDSHAFDGLFDFGYFGHIGFHENDFLLTFGKEFFCFQDVQERDDTCLFGGANSQERVFQLG